MKLAWTFLFLSAALLFSSLVDAGEREHRKKERAHYQHDVHRQHGKKGKHSSDHHRAHKKYKHDRYYAEHRSKGHHHSRKHEHGHADYWSGAVLAGSALRQALRYDHGFCPDRRHRHHRPYRYGDFVWSDYTQSCYRVQRGRYGEVFKEVPRRRCF